MYLEKELVSIGKRENNKKRNYLVINPLQGKHIPAAPGRVMELFDALADTLKDKYRNERLLLIGFAETATAVGAEAAIRLGTKYIQTTREAIPGAEYIYFSEVHSHAAEQKLVKNDIDRVIDGIDRIVFMEDEITTGNTILNIVNIMEDLYGRNMRFSAASILNGMSEEHLKRYKERGIRLHYLLKTDHEAYGRMAEQYAENGSYEGCDTSSIPDVRELYISGRMDARRLVNAPDYREACKALWSGIEEAVSFEKEQSVLVIGTEEFMYPPLFIADRIEKLGCKVRCHSTTRSPIAVSRDEGYPLRTRYELKSLYDKDRRTFIYDVGKYDRVFVITDACNCEEEGKNSLLHAVGKNNENVTLIRWCKK